jgi:hypothetical protein
MADKKMSPKNKKLAAMTPPYNKVTRGDVIKGAQMKKGGNSKGKKK